jgi:phosphoadenosine phosphosulfate reductase
MKLDLREWKDKPLEEKIELSHRVIEMALSKSRRPAVAFSGGKNSLVVLHMVLQHKPDVAVVFNNTTNEFPETLKFVRQIAEEWDLNFHEVKPKLNFWQVVKKYGFPSTSRWYDKEPKCCKYLKTRPAAKFYKEKRIDCVFTGISAFESRVRLLWLMHAGMIYEVKNEGGVRYRFTKVAPIGFWTNVDVWRYIEQHNLPVNPAYKKYGIDRIGCMVCTGHLRWKEQLHKVSPVLYRKVMHMMGYSVLEDYAEG